MRHLKRLRQGMLIRSLEQMRQVSRRERTRDNELLQPAVAVTPDEEFRADLDNLPS